MNNWKIMLSKSVFIKKHKEIAGICAWQDKTIWINDNIIYAGKEWLNGIIDKKYRFLGINVNYISKLSYEQRFILLLNHELFHAVYHSKIIRCFILFVFSISIAEILGSALFIENLIYFCLIITIIIFFLVPISMILEEYFAYKKKHEYECIDKNLFDKLK